MGTNKSRVKPDKLSKRLVVEKKTDPEFFL